MYLGNNVLCYYINDYTIRVGILYRYRSIIAQVNEKCTRRSMIWKNIQTNFTKKNTTSYNIIINDGVNLKKNLII